MQYQMARDASNNGNFNIRTRSDDGEDPMEEDMVPTGRTLRRRKEKVAKHMRGGLMKKKRKISERGSSRLL